MSLYTRIIDLQKLSQAWERVRKNKPAAGVDQVSWELFHERKREELKQLQIELSQHTYETLPVQKITIYKNDKSREIALYSMRDKVVQQSIALELNRIFDGNLCDATYAYRADKSALSALGEIENQIKCKGYSYALKIDISHFFDCIRWNKLEGFLRKYIQEEDVLELIRQNSVTRVLEDTGELIEKTVGIHQGSSTAPILSNIYLMELDHWISKQHCYYIRYSDDLLILGNDRDELMILLTSIRIRLQNLGLQINDNKTICVSLDEGLEYLGHFFNSTGKTIPQKAKDNLQERLEFMWLTSNISFEEKVKKAVMIIDGWEQYFREEREIESIFEFTAVLTLAKKNSSNMQILAQKRYGLTNLYRDIAGYLGKCWSDAKCYDMELFEYEQFYQVPQVGNKELDFDSDSGKGARWKELLALYRRSLVNEKEELCIEIMQIYTDLHEYENASFWMDRINEIQKKSTEITIPNFLGEECADQMYFNKQTAVRVMKHFAGREDVYALESLGNGGKRQSEIQFLPITEQTIEEHLKGQCTIGTYIQRPNSTVHYIVIDVDISKKVLLQYDRSTPEFKSYLEKAGKQAKAICKLYHDFGIKGYIEYSGCRGYHVWLLFTEWIPVRYANMFCDLLQRKLENDEDITIEYFPNKTRVKAEKYGQCLKLPFGRHSRTGELSYFLDESGLPIHDLNGFMDGLARFQLPAIKKILAANTEFTEQGKGVIEFDDELFKDQPPRIKTVLENCNLMRYLCQKTYKTGYLAHFERLSILYVFGHLGDEGKEFIHTLMKQTLNYQYQVTERFINKIPDKPISCIKLREQYKSLTAEYGCSCNFKRSKNCYPSPVLHAIALSSDASESITIPTSRTLTKEKEQKVIDELNIHKKAEELAGRILDLKKQRRKLDASVKKVENELSKLYDAEGIDCLEIELGLLVRRKIETGYEWLIEI